MQGGSSQVRFQPRIGQFMAAASGNVVSIFDAESDRQTHSLQVWISALYFTKFLTVSLICLPEKGVLYCHKLLLIRQHNVLNLYRATPQRCTLFVGIQMEIIWLQSVKSLWECGHYRLGSAFTSSVLVETCSILVFSIQATPLSWSLEATRWVCFYDVNVELRSNFVYEISYILTISSCDCLIASRCDSFIQIM